MTSTDERVPPMGSEAQEINFIEINNGSHHNLKENINIHNNPIILENSNKLTNNKQPFPNYETWRLSFQDLLDDPEGYKTYYEFLETEQLSVLFECWYCCQQYRCYPPNKATAKDVYSRFVRIKDSRVPISDQARNNLALRLRSNNNITESLLNEIENEVYANLRDICYPKFLKSDFFTFYCETAGQVHYDPSEFHKFGKPSSTLKRGKKQLNVVNENEAISTYSRSSYDLSHEYNERGFYAPNPSKCHTDIQSLSSDAHTESDRLSMTDSRVSGGSGGRYSRNPRSYNHDQLQDLPNFQPRTQRINQERMRQMKPTDFAAILTQKLEQVIIDRQVDSEKSIHQHSSTDHMNMKNIKQSLPNYHHNNNNQQQVSHNNNTEYEPSECDTQSWAHPPMSDRYSVAGQSSHSGSHSGVMVNKKAKELRDIVHHQLRNDLGECKCQDCHEKKFHERYYSNQSQNYPSNEKQSTRYPPNHSSSSYYPHSNHSSHNSHSHHSSGYHHSHEQIENNRYNTEHSTSSSNRRPEHRHDANIDNPELVAPLDTSKIYNWMEKNERYKNQESFTNPAPSPSLRRKKKPVVYDTSRAVQPIAQDLGMPLLPQPDTGNVLEEVKRVLEEPHQRHHQPSSTTKKSTSSRSRTGAYHHHEMYQGSEMYEKNSMASGPWSMSDASSQVSYNTSQVSTVPSSASRLWNNQGYFDTGSEVRDERASDVRSHSTGRHSGARSGPRSVTRSDHVSNVRSDHQSEVRSQSTGRSHGSDNSRSKTKTVITYYYGVDPIPFRINIPTIEVTLGQFKAETKKGNYRFFFKTISNVDGEVVYEEVKNDEDILPKYNDKIIGKVEKIE